MGDALHTLWAMRKILSLLAIAALLVVTGCSAKEPAGDASSSPADPAVLQRLGFEGMTGKQIVEQVDRDAQPRPLAFYASVRPTGLLLKDDQGSTTVPLPTDEFYLSIAPYATSTHDCHFHSLGTCNGELKDVEVSVKITAADGTVLVDEKTSTYAGNGFVGFWIPKGKTGTVQVTTADGKSGSAPFSSAGDEDATCMTTLKVA